MVSFIWNENNKYFCNNAMTQIKEACIFQGTEVQTDRNSPLPSVTSSFILTTRSHFMQEQDDRMSREEYGQA